MTKCKDNLELYYIEKKIKNELIDNIFIRWNIDSIHFLLSIFPEKKYKKFHNICLSILFDYVKWFKYENNYLYNRSYYPSDLDYIYCLISNDLLNNTNIDVNYIDKLEQHIKTENINNKAFYYPNYSNNYIDTNNSFSNNFNFFYIMEIIFFIFILAILFFIKYIYSCINISNKSYKKIEFENQYPISFSSSYGNILNNNDKNNKINNLFNTDILFSKLTSLLEKDTFKNDLLNNPVEDNNSSEKTEKINNNKSFLDFISLMKNLII